MALSAAHRASQIRTRELGPDDLDAVEALHRLAIGPVARPEVVKPENRAYFQSVLAGRGRSVGVFDGESLVAYGILQHDHTPEDGPHRLLKLPAETAVGRLAGASVHPDYRGLGLQRVVIAERVALAPQHMVLFSTAAPVNAPSWSNLLSGGFPIVGIEFFFGGYARYVMLRDGSTYDPEAGVVVDPRDVARQQALFAQGWRGYARTRLKGGEPGVVFAPALFARG
ncbi:GNAT family N-acetyltransferase [Xanthobacter agilis]|uniref:Ribosomal protein S18 acetylase RimI-like enzyme n=1 Tax=Xanthobacter agilis TaxID=47492 RepID=A0ABU0LGL4_XANAG|nr:GNAT family N-acetyltransferase [Xanthobacter agilis]MDQ0506284.1 ribosomal protein S18 acetylase RimI-like enzyme [Xanthobacter agilis]